MKLNCVVIDDEKPARSILKRYIEQIPFLELSDEFKGPVDALPLLEAGDIDLMFLDIRMPQMSGLAFIRTLTEKPAIVITTAYRDFALEGFDLEVDDYLLKPIPMERFLRSVNKVREKLMVRPVVNAAATDEFLVLKSDKRLFRVRPEDILFIQSNREYATYYTKSFGKITVHVSMKQLEEELSGHIFLRVHRSYIVNTGYARQLRGNTLMIEEHEIPVSSSYKEAIMQLF